MKRMLLLSLLCVSSCTGAAQNPLELAVSYGNMQRVVKLLNDSKNGYDSVALGKALWFACPLESDDIAELLIMRGADVDVQNDTGWTPLLRSCYGPVSKPRLLLRQKANINHANDVGATPLHSAIKFAQPDTVKLLLEHQADLDIPDNQGVTPLSATFIWGSPEERKQVKEILAPYKATALQDK